jgi:hypothetical protein
VVKVVALLGAQSFFLVLTAAVCYRIGLRAGFARGENRGIHGVLQAIREVLDDEDRTDPGMRH